MKRCSEMARSKLLDINGRGRGMRCGAEQWAMDDGALDYNSGWIEAPTLVVYVTVFTYREAADNRTWTLTALMGMWCIEYSAKHLYPLPMVKFLNKLPHSLI